ncbi:MAG: RimK family protein [Candidatus Aureabacteria bacterium]|nr:RimK family protein [Candidatus Auribacterota bacterium]
MHNIIVVNNPKRWHFHIEGVEVVSAKAYLTDNHYAEIQPARIFNLCRSYRYQTAGYYVSLLAEARGQRVFPDVATIQDLLSQTIVRVISGDIDELIQRSLKGIKSREFVLSIYFGKNIAKKYERLCQKLSNLFQAPFLRARFIYTKKWVLQFISPIPLNEIPEKHHPYVLLFAKEFFSRKKFALAKRQKYLYDLAILVNPEEKEPPSDKKAVHKFIEASRSLGFFTEIITREDYSRIPEFDALFIRETTFVDHYTYRFSRRAFMEGLVVIDDPLSILRCTNKVYLTEMMTKTRIPIPKTIIVHKNNWETIEKDLGLPCVLKQPDSSFSLGVKKIDNRESLMAEIDNLLDDSDLVIAQEYIPTDFDWRIGIIDKTPLYACKYFMAKGHWQIYNWTSTKKSHNYGAVETLMIESVPEKVVKTALKAANFIGDGFYGVDIKQIGQKVYVIEINDNPSIESGVEDAVLKDNLYMTIMQTFLKRLEKKA